MANILYILQNVEIVCKTPCKFLRKSMAKLCANNLFTHEGVDFPSFSHSFPHFPTHFFTSSLPLFYTNLFHFCTSPTNTTTNNLLII